MVCRQAPSLPGDLYLLLRQEVRLFVGGQEQFVAELTGNQNRLYAYILSLLGDPGVAEDVLQATNLVLWKKSADWQPGSSFIAWARTVAHYEVMTWRKQAARDRLVFSERTLDLIDDEQRTESAQFPEREGALIDCLGELSGRQRKLLDLRYAHGSSVQAIAQQTGSEPNAIAQALFRARQALAKCMRLKLAREVS